MTTSCHSMARRLMALGAVASLALLSACAPERPQPTEPTLNLVSGCFDSVSAMGQHYVLVGCLTKEELSSLKTFRPGSPAARYTTAVESEYVDALKQYPQRGEVHQPTFNLVTGCFEGIGSRWDIFKRKKCLATQDFSPRVQRKVDQVMAAYYGQAEADSEATRPRYSPPSTDVDITPILLII